MTSQNLSLGFSAVLGIGKVQADWVLANVAPVFKKCKKEDPGNYMSVHLTSVPGKGEKKGGIE